MQTTVKKKVSIKIDRRELEQALRKRLAPANAEDVSIEWEGGPISGLFLEYKVAGDQKVDVFDKEGLVLGKGKKR